ncbi:MAG: DEAD/DEAH box helicase [Candidatus Xenobia bacterium]
MSLLQHQLHGVAWLQAVWRDRPGSGVLLADDMGLGKTLQAWTFLERLRTGAEAAEPSLIIAPVGLLENWKGEYGKFFNGAGSLPEGMLLVLHGAELARMRLAGGGNEIGGDPIRKLDTQTIARYPIVLTSYETVRDYQFSLGSIKWGVVVTDEAQRIKNPTALITMAVKALHARFRVASTGTPVENSLADLWCIMDFVHPGQLGCLKDFMKLHGQPELAQLPTLAEDIRRAAAPHFLRRRKRDILTGLPPRHDHVVPLAMTRVQESQYLALVQAYRESQAHSQQAMLELLLCLRRICSVADDLPENASASGVAAVSSKVEWLFRQLDEIRDQGEKVLIFDIIEGTPSCNPSL